MDEAKRLRKENARIARKIWRSVRHNPTAVVRFTVEDKGYANTARW